MLHYPVSVEINRNRNWIVQHVVHKNRNQPLLVPMVFSEIFEQLLSEKKTEEEKYAQ